MGNSKGNRSYHLDPATRLRDGGGMLNPRKKKRKPFIPNVPPVRCPYCSEWLPEPARIKKAFSSDSLGGRCACGILFILDLTGRSGGLALMDLQTLACDGDIDRALKLREGVDFEMISGSIEKLAGARQVAVRGHSYMQPWIWAMKLKGPAEG
ncbi:MAG: hypothetical protein V2A76_03125 [Planctomycetota bacterium]